MIRLFFLEKRHAPATTLFLFIMAFTAAADAKKPDRPRPRPEPTACATPQPDYVIFLDDYPTGRFHLAVLPCLTDETVPLVNSQELALDLPRSERRKFQVANGDIYIDGGVRRIVFGGRTGPSAYWGIYEGVVDIDRGSITGIKVIVSTPMVREEDPRFSANGDWIVFKRNGEIWRIYARGSDESPHRLHRQSGCELWAPSRYANVTSYVRRCDGKPESDRIVYHLDGHAPVTLPSLGGGPDRFAHFTSGGNLVYSHLDTSAGTASLWMYLPGSAPFPLHDETGSDDDPYAERNGDEYIAFSGWGNSSYDLYVYRRTLGSAVQLTSGINVFGSILVD